VLPDGISLGQVLQVFGCGRTDVSGSGLEACDPLYFVMLGAGEEEQQRVGRVAECLRHVGVGRSMSLTDVAIDSALQLDDRDARGDESWGVEGQEGGQQSGRVLWEAQSRASVLERYGASCSPCCSLVSHVCGAQAQGARLVACAHVAIAPPPECLPVFSLPASFFLFPTCSVCMTGARRRG
jgi:hypothetical protein